MIICRSDREIEQEVLEKLSLFCNVAKDHVFHSIDVDSIYKVPLKFHQQGLDEKVTELLGMWTARPNTKDLDKVVYNWEHPLREIKIGIVGKYTDLTESYKSLDEALQHAAIENQLKLSLVYIDAEEIEDDSRREDILKEIHGILVPGGFGERGTEGKIKAIEFARKNKVPFFGICLGMQLAMVEFARNVADLKEATSEEFSETGDHVIHYMDGQTRDGSKGGSMRLGAYECQLQKGTLVNKIYGKSEISERHRHRLEVNNDYINKIKSHGMVISGVNEKLNLVEVIELEDHPYFIACQYHPEFKSRPYDPHPLFKTFIEAADKERKE
jgi:CTP synthase